MITIVITNILAMILVVSLLGVKQPEGYFEFINFKFEFEGHNYYINVYDNMVDIKCFEYEFDLWTICYSPKKLYYFGIDGVHSNIKEDLGIWTWKEGSLEGASILMERPSNGFKERKFLNIWRDYKGHWRSSINEWGIFPEDIC